MDSRNLRQKLEDMVRLGTPYEADRARDALARLAARQATPESPAAALRERIKASPSETRSARLVRIRTSYGTVLVDESDFETLRAFGWLRQD